jgi:RES domain
VSQGNTHSVSTIEWQGTVRIIRSAFPPIDLFEDIADPADWPLLISAEQKTNPRIMATVGNLDLVPTERRVGGSGASYLMAPFTHISTDRPSRFTDGSFGVLYVGKVFETALFETLFHHARFMARTAEVPGWTSQFREITLSVRANLHDLRSTGPDNPLRRAGPMASSIQASAISKECALPCSIRTARQIPSKGGTLTTTGMVSALIWSAMPQRARSFVLLIW